MKLIILDRDGVINQDSDEFIKSPEEWIAIPGSLEAIAKLNQAGYTVVVVTNQSGIGRGYFTLAALEKIHQKMQAELKKVGGKIDKIYICPHKPDEECDCRKPKIGLFKKVAEDFQVDLHQVFAIGDSQRDYQAGLAAGCQCILVLTGKGEKALEANPALGPVKLFNDLTQAVDFILS